MRSKEEKKEERENEKDKEEDCMIVTDNMHTSDVGDKI